MMSKVAIRNVYMDYLLSTQGHISATDLSEVVDNEYSHDQISRMLYHADVDDKKLYRQSKRIIKAQNGESKKVLILDDSVQPKPHSKVNGMIAYHYDHSQQRCIKGINFISALWADDQCSIPVSMKVVVKELQWDHKRQQEAWKVVQTKNEIFREMVGKLTRNGQIDYVLADSWYASKENMDFITTDCKTQFVMAIKSNRLATRSEKDSQKGIYKPLQDLRLGKCAVKVYLNELDYEGIFTLYKRRWKVEEYHKSLKSNCSLGKCQASSHSSQQSHFYLAVLAFIQLEKARMSKGKNHFGLIRDINILTCKYGLLVVKKYLHTTLTSLQKAA